MKVVHMGGGLGNQMASYATLVAARLANPNDKFFIETLVYNISEADKSCCQWNGYELEKVFGIHEKNVLDELNEYEKVQIIKDLCDTKFWEEDKEDLCIAQILNKYGFPNQYADIHNSIEKTNYIFNNIKCKCLTYLNKQSNFYFEYFLKNNIKKILIGKFPKPIVGYKKRNENYYYPACTFEFMKTNWLQKKIGNELLKAFQFKPINDEKNLRLMKIIEENNSVSIHARRSDFLKYNNDCYKFGYFKRCVSFIRKKVDNPIWIIFSEESEWCRKNLNVFGLDYESDKVFFVDWNLGYESYRDMQLMSLCKHNITTKSSFGWWASFLNQNPNKITCSQIGEYITTNQF